MDSFLEVRNDLSRLKMAGKFLKAILHSQYPEKPTNLYPLLKSFLCKLKTAKKPGNLGAAFYSKLLKYEGVLPESKTEASTPFSDEEWKLLHLLSNTTHFSQFEELELPPTFEENVHQFFYTAL